ncbi:SRPBCC domain-containing protein [Corynebacteriaceae bacterium 6-324]
MTDVLHLQAHINAPAAKVYEAMTASSTLRTWLAEYAEVSIADDRFVFFGGPTTPQGLNPNQKLLEAQPNQLLRIEWTLDGQPTTVEFGITENQETSIVSLKQDGLPTLEELMSP